MCRVVLTVALLVGSGRIATAGHRAHIVTEPPGAHVYINDTESGAVCDATPCDIDPPYGESSLIVQLEKYAPEIQGIDVKRGGPMLSVRIKLKAAIATLVLDDPSARGASITIDGADRGKVPARIDVEPGGHQLKVSLRGKAVFDDFVDVETGDEKTIALAATPQTKDTTPTKSAAPSDSVEPNTTVADSGDSASPASSAEEHDEVSSVAVKPRRRRFVAGNVVIDLASRNFEYLQPMGAPLAPAKNSALGVYWNSLAGGTVELWPFELLAIPALRELSLYGRVEVGVVGLAVANTNGAQTSEARKEISARYRQWLGGHSIALDGSVGYVDDQATFSGPADSVVMLPEADYAGLRAGLAVVAALGPVEAYAAIEGRDVLSSGALAARWQTSSVSGLGGEAGIAATFAREFGQVVARVQVEDMHYNWTFGNPVAPYPGHAAGAVDKLYGVTMSAGFQY
jgi:hypothetical protein